LARPYPHARHLPRFRRWLYVRLAEHRAGRGARRGRRDRGGGDRLPAGTYVGRGPRARAAAEQRS